MGGLYQVWFLLLYTGLITVESDCTMDAMTAKNRPNKALRHAAAVPFIWGMILPLIPLHVLVFIYQAVAFRLYGIDRVSLRSFINFDREKLSYLSLGDKINCAYCSYANGLLAYCSEIGRRTEYYWCGIKHLNQPNNPAFAYQAKFAAYGSEEEYEKVVVASGRKPKCD